MGIRTNWQHDVETGNISLPQIEHLEKCIHACGSSVSLISPFKLWETYANSSEGQLRLYAQSDWQHISEIVSIVDQQDSEWVYIAINRYLLICDPDVNANADYDQAIFEYINSRLKNYIIVEYQYQALNYTGKIGNFVSPDNRMLCKKILYDH
jgi:hypothetical protein